QIKRIPVTIEEQMDFIRKKLEFDREIVFTSLVTGLKMKIQIVYTFIAMLEMVRMQLIGVKESDSFNDFVVYSIEND
ncbi:MAG: segregation/condensation protein A, partial [Chlorobiota bacterium]